MPVILLLLFRCYNGKAYKLLGLYLIMKRREARLEEMRERVSEIFKDGGYAVLDVPYVKKFSPGVVTFSAEARLRDDSENPASYSFGFQMTEDEAHFNMERMRKVIASDLEKCGDVDVYVKPVRGADIEKGGERTVEVYPMNKSDFFEEKNEAYNRIVGDSSPNSEKWLGYKRIS
jgi:hypothetical protein